MVQSNWRRVKDIFHEAVALPPEQRAVFLDQACQTNEAIRGEVRALLEAETGKLPFLEKPLLTQGFAADAPLKPGDRLGAYQIERELGAGGMGRVYRAVRADGLFERVVAIKVLKHGLDSKNLLVRFQKERQILAHLNHPNIARLYEGGVTEEGWPYFVMEYVAGVAIDRYCRDRWLTVRQRLDLFREVCDAVHYAHRHLVIHRDLKPANILVAESGAPKLLDFGIAKLLNPPSVQSLTLTELGNLPMTPEYASPEQVRGESVTTSSDVYALGVLLYELLTGKRPYSLTGQTAEAVRRIVVEYQPLKPSIAVMGEPPSSDPAAQSPEKRRTKPGPIRQDLAKLRRALVGDLDNIVLMALRKEPERRYHSAEQFSGDLGRFLRGLPVLARKETWTYLTAKLIARYRIAMFAAALAFLLLLAFTAIVGFQHQKVKREQVRATRISEFLKGIFAGTSPFDTGGEKVTALWMLEQAANRVSADFEQEPDIQAELYITIGRSFEELGFEQKSLPLFERALSLNRAVYGANHLKVSDCLALIAHGLYQLGDHARAEARIKDAIAILVRKPDTQLARIADMTGLLAQVRRARGEFADAGAVFKRAEALYQRAGVKDPLFLNQYAGFLTELGEYPRAEPLFLEALALQNERNNHANLGETHNDLGLLYRKQGRMQEAETHYRAALDLIRPILGEKSPRVITVLGNLASLFCYQKRYAEAETLLETILRNTTETEPGRPNTLNSLAEIYRRQGDFAKAEPLYLAALALTKKHHGSGGLFTVALHYNLSCLYRDAASYELAERHILAALELVGPTKGSPHRARILNALGDIYLLSGKRQRAESALEEAKSLVEQSTAKQQPMFAAILHNLARLHFEGHNFTAAESYCRNALALREKLDPGDARRLETSTLLAKIQNAVKPPNELKSMAKKESNNP